MDRNPLSRFPAGPHEGRATGTAEDSDTKLTDSTPGSRSTQSQEGLPLAMGYRAIRRLLRCRSLPYLFLLVCLTALTYLTLLGGQTSVAPVITFPPTPTTPTPTTPAPTTALSLANVTSKPRNDVRPAPVTSQPFCRKEERHVAFVKVHKTGSTTVANILQRFGIVRNLSFVIPLKKFHEDGYNYIGRPGFKIPGEAIRRAILTPPKGQGYDLLWNHVVYDRDAFRSIMPTDTAYVAILREPFEQFVSAFEYFGRYGPLASILHLNVRNPLATFLQNPHRFLPLLAPFSNVRNKQALDLGMSERHLRSPAERDAYIRQMERDFRVVILTEYFDESLVLLRRRLCWSLKDILYGAKNRNPRKDVRYFSDDDRARHRQFSPLDYALYDHFHRRLWDDIWAEGPDLLHEVRHFRSVQRSALDHCTMGQELLVPPSPWNEEFKVTKDDCTLMMLSELALYDKILDNYYAAYNASDPVKLAYLHQKAEAEEKRRLQLARMRGYRRDRFRRPHAGGFGRRMRLNQGRQPGQSGNDSMKSLDFRGPVQEALKGVVEMKGGNPEESAYTPDEPQEGADPRQPVYGGRGVEYNVPLPHLWQP